MLAVEDVVSELMREEEQGLPPGFRFHPTDEELITFYLASKVFHGTFCGVQIAEIDLNRCEPWELPDVAKMGEREWYFYSMRDRKYPSGLRTNRATEAGYWKATGKDREVYSNGSGTGSSGGGTLLVGMKKTLVFYKGRAPRGVKTKWVMHEYRLHSHFSSCLSSKEEWVICRIVHKLGEKKTPSFQGQHYPLQASSSSSSSTTSALFEAPTTRTTMVMSQSNNPLMQVLQNPFVNHHHHHQESDLKSLFNPVLSQPSFSPHTTNTNYNNISPSLSNALLFNSFLSHQDFTLKEQATVSKQFKTEPNFSHFQLCDANMSWVDRIHPNPLFFGMNMDCSVMGYSSSYLSSAATASDTPPTFGLTADSWPWDF